MNCWLGGCSKRPTATKIETWSLTSLRERLIKTGARLVRHARYAVFPEKNDSKNPLHPLVKDVPVDGFWLVTLYVDEGYMPVNKYNAYSFNNLTAKKDKDGSITIHFGGDPKADNLLPIVPRWNYTVRMYKPRSEILNGSWTFPNPQVVE
jgi:hypothetical protein